MIRSSSSCAARSGAATSSPSAAARACWRRCSATGTGSSRRPITAPRRAPRCTRRNTCVSLKPPTRAGANCPTHPEEVVANVHPFPGQPCTYPEHIVGLAGYHMGDTACPIGAGTWEAAAWSAHCATPRGPAGAGRRARGLRVVPSAGPPRLCRPRQRLLPLNNAAIAAQHLRAAHARVAILDLTCITAMAPRASSTAAPTC